MDEFTSPCPTDNDNYEYVAPDYRPVEIKIVTEAAAYWIHGASVGSTPEDVTNYLTEHLTSDYHSHDFTFTCTVDYYAARVETKTLVPVQSLSDPYREVTVYLAAARMREAGSKIQAIQLYREFTGAVLKEAKDTIEGQEFVSLGGMEIRVAGIINRLLLAQIRTGIMDPVGPFLWAER